MQYNVTYREKDGGIQFIISYKDRHGKWKQKSKQGFAQKKQAKKAAENLLDELKKAHELQLNEELEEISFKEFAEMYIENLKIYKEFNTVLTYEQTIKKFNSLSDKELIKITAVHVQKCIDELVKAGLKPSTIKAHATRLKTIFKAAISPYRAIITNPVSDLKLPEKKQNVKDKALNLSDLEKFLRCIKNKRYYLMSLIAAKCGLRLAEIIGLTWNDINLKDFTIDVNKQWKRNKAGVWGFGPLKSKSSYRIVPMHKSVCGELAEYKKITPTNIDRRIFPYHNANGISSVLSNFYKSLGYNLTIHDLRHTFATLLIAGGTDYRTAAQILGHTPEETMRTYAHVTSDMMKQATKNINNIFG